LKDGIGKADRELVKRESRELLIAVRARLAELDGSERRSRMRIGG
jgi:hypothetical protein